MKSLLSYFCVVSHLTGSIYKISHRIPLAKRLLEHDTYLIGTLRSNRGGSGNEVAKKNLRLGKVYGLRNKEGVKLIMWKNKRIMKPQVLLDYNGGRIGTDLSDQLSSYYACLRRSIKWYQKVAFYLVFGTVLVNSYLILEENYTTSKMTILQFRESLVRSLLLGMPFEKLKPGVR